MRLRTSFLFLFVIMLLLAVPTMAQEQLTHVIQPGETLFRISQQYGISVEAIAAANTISNTWTIYSGQTLVIPSSEVAALEIAAALPDVPQEEASTDPQAAPAQEEAAAEESEAAEPAVQDQQTHRVAWGESLGSIARRYNMSLEELAELNNITNPDLIYSGQELVVVPGAGTEATGDPDAARGSVYSSITHVVQSGETLVAISETYGVSWLQIAQANGINNADLVLPGVELIIPGGEIIPGVDYSFVTAGAAPSARIGAGREIIVDLSEQRVYAYEDGVLVRNVLASTGLPATPTVQGDFTVQRKYVAQTMTGPGYYLPDVPYILYFYAGYALHGTYWHENFGQPMSHGCVNLPTPEAEWFYNFADYGTPIHVQT
ncbi:MAG: LysM peptidoglycan-binding domain-containing protein [Chloroflexi bacterium]|nr:LysM peptidoglycan-binding domain-containing protein [Chloroflexota bacterium]